jgi:hypothetical protein
MHVTMVQRVESSRVESSRVESGMKEDRYKIKAGGENKCEKAHWSQLRYANGQEEARQAVRVDARDKDLLVFLLPGSDAVSSCAIQ